MSMDNVPTMSRVEDPTLVATGEMLVTGFTQLRQPGLPQVAYLKLGLWEYLVIMWFTSNGWMAQAYPYQK